MRAVVLNYEFSSFICKFPRNFYNKPNRMKILKIFQETKPSNEAK